MEKILTGFRELYNSKKGVPRVIRIQVRLCDLVDPGILRHAVDTTMKRYPYFCVELKKQEDDYIFEENPRPVVVLNTLHGAELNTEESNNHMVSFFWHDNWIVMDVFHGLTDGTGANEVLRTLMNYYCSERYGISLPSEGVRLAGDEIPFEEWEDPVREAELPVPERKELVAALDPIAAANLQEDNVKTVYSVVIPEEQFMAFNHQYGGSPVSMVSLMLGRGAAKLFPDHTDPIRIVLPVNQRKALHAPLAHQSLVGGILLEYGKEFNDLSLSEQIASWRRMISAQMTEEAILAGVAVQKGLSQLVSAKKNDTQRCEVAAMVDKMTERSVTANVSYIGKADYKEAEQFIREFRVWTCPVGNRPVIEMAAVNGKFILSFIQPFQSPVFVNAFLKELSDHGITYDLQDVMPLNLPDIHLPWAV